jgi:hypothetical protein
VPAAVLDAVRDPVLFRDPSGIEGHCDRLRAGIDPHHIKPTADIAGAREVEQVRDDRPQFAEAILDLLGEFFDPGDTAQPRKARIQIDPDLRVGHVIGGDQTRNPQIQFRRLFRLLTGWFREP